MDKRLQHNLEKHIPQYQSVMIENIYACLIWNIALDMQKTNPTQPWEYCIRDAYQRISETKKQLREYFILDDLQLPELLQSHSIDKRTTEPKP
jgi:hypothetical protein